MVNLQKKQKPMIQRIQTLFMFLTLVLLSILIYNPIATYFIEPNMDKIVLNVFGVQNSSDLSVELLQNYWFLFAFIILVMLITFVTIFLYKRRVLQIRLCIVTIVMLVGLQGVMYYMVTAIGQNLHSKPHYNLVFIFPLIAAVLNFLAIRGIAKDEALIRSLDRLR
ncbi:DUF4293 family protein [Tenuifilum thalassicum]|uniref:DUF4293 family protein n=2 Tax=Tenuifilaceae TaxID=2760872 RepID=A0A7D3XKE3_9BACT|nr:DUF4293 family protein [Tenuifilum thalassicum]